MSPLLTRRVAVGFAAAAALGGLAACGSSSSSKPAATTTTAAASAAATGGGTTASSNTVMITNFMFMPMTLDVKVGTKVTWMNMDSATHTVTANDKSFDSGDLAQGKSYSFTFTKAGTYDYICNIHQYMTASVVVS